MDQPPLRDHRLIEALEALRPDGEDLSDPALASLADALAADQELRELRDRSAELDRRLGATFNHVAVPEGLADRIVARVTAAPAADRAATRAAPRRRTRRWFAGAAIAASVAASVAIWVLPLRRPQPMSVEEVQRGAIDFALSQDDARQPGELLTQHSEPAELPFSRDLYHYRDIRVRHVEGLLGRKGVAYDVRSDFGSSATLYVVRIRQRGAPPAPQDLPQQPPAYRDTTSGTRGLRAAAWRSGDLLYVLVIHGDRERTYNHFVLPPGAVA